MLCFEIVLPAWLREVPTPTRQRKIIGEAVRKYRKQSGLTQEKLAEKAELDSTYISDVERGEENISVDALMRIANALNVRLKDFIQNL